MLFRVILFIVLSIAALMAANSKKMIKSIIFITVFLFSGGVLFAHPHIFIQYSVEIEITGNAVSGISSVWEFDKAYSSTLIMDFDKNQDGKLSPKEITELKNKAFIGLIDYEYFTFIDMDSRRLKISSVSGFSPSIAGGRMIYRFFIPLNQEIKKNACLKINIFDPTIYIDFSLKNQPMISNSSGVNVKCDVIDHSKDRCFFDGETAIKEIDVQITK
jgi:ABC-type uncharacterized transport system substrate-binding protein